jgi:energy-coupling factor transport system ATP-binding protein
VALVEVDGLTFSYPGTAAPALRDIRLRIERGEVIALLGPSGSGKSTLLRALAGLVPHFHGGRYSGHVSVAGLDTRRARPAELARLVATVFQDPEDQVVMTTVGNEVAFGLENLGTPPPQIWPRVEEALRTLDVAALRQRRTAELSGGELQRVCLASAIAMRPELILLDEPTSQLDPAGAEALLDAVPRLGAAVVLSEQRIERALELADRVLFVEGGRLVLDASKDAAVRWLAGERPAFAGLVSAELAEAAPSDAVVIIDNAWFSYDRDPVLAGASLEVRRGELVVLEGPNGSGKTTLAKIAAGLLKPSRGSIRRDGRAGYLSQDPGRYVVCETVLDEAALAVGGDERRARASLAAVGLEWAARRHPRDLSSGERERLGLVAVAVAEPDLLVLDEPTRGIDPDRKIELAELLARYAQRGGGVLVVTHDRSFPAHRRVALGGAAAVREEELLVGA